MKRILVLNGSPKAKSDTMRLTTAFLDGIKSVCECQVETVNTIEKQVKPCLGCFSCWRTGKCAQTDDMSDILAQIISADIVIWSYPLYSYGMPSQLKAVLDRTLPLSRQSMREQNGRTVHDSVSDFSDKHFVMISGCGFPNFEHNFEPAVQQFNNCFRHNATTVCVPEAPMLNAPEAAAVVNPLLEKFKSAGADYAVNGNLSAAVLAQLQNPMIPSEVYIKIVNGQ